MKTLLCRCRLIFLYDLIFETSLILSYTTLKCCNLSYYYASVGGTLEVYGSHRVSLCVSKFSPQCLKFRIKALFYSYSMIDLCTFTGVIAIQCPTKIILPTVNYFLTRQGDLCDKSEGNFEWNLENETAKKLHSQPTPYDCMHTTE